MKNKNYLAININWQRTDDALFPFQTRFDGEDLKIRINDFPSEPLYTLLVNGKEVADFNNWSESWSKPRKQNNTMYLEGVAY